MKLRNQIKELTEDLTSTKEIPIGRARHNNGPRTAIGKMAEFSAAKIRFAELEKQIFSSDANVSISEISPAVSLKSQLIKAHSRFVERELRIAACDDSSETLTKIHSTSAMDSDFDIDLDIALRKIHQLGFEDGDNAAEYRSKIARLLKSTKKYRDRALAAEELLRRLEEKRSSSAD